MSWKDLKNDEQFTGKIKILKLVKTYNRGGRNINIYETTKDSYIPFIHQDESYLDQFEIGKTYEINGYFDGTDKMLRITNSKKLD